jgi:hypothetical protein
MQFASGVFLSEFKFVIFIFASLKTKLQLLISGLVRFIADEANFEGTFWLFGL